MELSRLYEQLDVLDRDQPSAGALLPVFIITLAMESLHIDQAIRISNHIAHRKINP